MIRPLKQVLKRKYCGLVGSGLLRLRRVGENGGTARPNPRPVLGNRYAGAGNRGGQNLRLMPINHRHTEDLCIGPLEFNIAPVTNS